MRIGINHINLKLNLLIGEYSQYKGGALLVRLPTADFDRLLGLKAQMQERS
ncbi:hypothetical protein AltI4_27780 [Alteromonas sp. I4]|nr:hypothetical protein AltI4_27780 [Alteromonas sp. I4]